VARVAELLAAQAEPAAAQGPPAVSSAPQSGRFVLEGDVWTLELGSLAVRVKDGRGPRYLALLLARPGEELLASDLVGLVAGTAGGMLGPSDGGPVIDTEARRAYEARVRELREQIADAERAGSADEADAARAELEEIARELAQAIGIGGRARRLGSSTERARQSVTKAIRALLRRVEELDPGLGRMLETSIRTGTFCSYVPDPRDEIRWRV
jgi:hypothetical protein